MGFVFNVSPGQHETSVRYSLLEAVNFISAFIDQQNEQGRIFCENFKATASNGYGVAYDEDRDEIKVSGISGSEYDLDGVFKEEFSAYIVESQVLMLWAMLEKNLDAIAQELFNIKEMPWTKLKGEGSNFSQYVKRIEDADSYSYDAAVVNFLDCNVRPVRNALVHGGSRKIEVENELLNVKNGVLLGVSHEYVTKTIKNIRYFAMELVSARH